LSLSVHAEKITSFKKRELFSKGLFAIKELHSETLHTVKTVHANLQKLQEMRELAHFF